MQDTSPDVLISKFKLMQRLLATLNRCKSGRWESIETFKTQEKYVPSRYNFSLF